MNANAQILLLPFRVLKFWVVTPAMPRSFADDFARGSPLEQLIAGEGSSRGGGAGRNLLAGEGSSRGGGARRDLVFACNDEEEAAAVTQAKAESEAKLAGELEAER